MIDQSAFAAFAPPIRQPSPLRQAITAAYRRDEAECLAPLLDAATLDDATKATLKTAVEAAKANPALVADTVAQVKTALGM